MKRVLCPQRYPEWITVSSKITIDELVEFCVEFRKKFSKEGFSEKMVEDILVDWFHNNPYSLIDPNDKNACDEPCSLQGCVKEA